MSAATSAVQVRSNLEVKLEGYVRAHNGVSEAQVREWAAQNDFEPAKAVSAAHTMVTKKVFARPRKPGRGQVFTIKQRQAHLHR